MSQPEKQPGGAPGARDGRRDDLLGGPFPQGDWNEPAQRLAELYRRAEQEAAATIRWYLARRTARRRLARLLRTGTALGLVAGAALPLLELAGLLDEAAVWGYLALLGAAACLGCDRCFRLTSGWMRTLATAQAVQRRLERLRYDWAAEGVREALGPPDGLASEAAERCLCLLRRFSEDVLELVRAETAQWMAEFPACGAPPPAGGGPGAHAPEPEPGPSRPPVGTRPHMPRQRPPERG